MYIYIHIYTYIYIYIYIHTYIYTHAYTHTRTCQHIEDHDAIHILIRHPQLPNPPAVAHHCKAADPLPAHEADLPQPFGHSACGGVQGAVRGGEG